MSFKKNVKMLLLEFTDFQDFPEPPTIFKDFPVLENARLKFRYFPGFPGPVRTLVLKCQAPGLDACIHTSDTQHFNLPNRS